MTLAKQLQEKLKGQNAKNLFESNLGDARSRLLQEVLITFKDNKFGNVVILAGGAGSGKGFVLKNLLDIQGKVFDVDRLKELALTNDYIQSVVKKEQGIDISKLDLKNPKDVSTLHGAIDKAGLDKKVKSTMFDSIVMAHPDRKPNLIFDVTLKSPDKLGKISEQVKSLG